MKVFNQKIALVKNSRGCYILDTIKGCSICATEKLHGCYDNCYAKNIADRYGIDFTSPIKRDFMRDTKQFYLLDFDDAYHISSIIKDIKKIDMPFVRIGEMGDPSEDWEHTLNVCSVISHAKKPIVIITKHWKQITNSMLDSIRMMNITINTSVSALDSPQELEYRLKQYKRLKPYCKSVLRIVTCDFNSLNPDGARMKIVQDDLIADYDYIDTVFRPSKTNRLVSNGVINIKKVKFMRSEVLASVNNKGAYLGMCNTCPDMCGV